MDPEKKIKNIACVLSLDRIITITIKRRYRSRFGRNTKIYDGDKKGVENRDGYLKHTQKT